MLLDKKFATQKEQVYISFVIFFFFLVIFSSIFFTFHFFHFSYKAKLDAKFLALENLEDIDDSISSISTLSDESDSGYEQSNWNSQLPTLTEVYEDDLDVINCSSWDDESTASSMSSSNSKSSMFTHNEVLSREDWDRILNKDILSYNEVRSRDQTCVSGNTPNSDHKHSTICNDSTIVEERRTSVNSITNPSNNAAIKESISAYGSVKSNSSWISSLFRKKTDSIKTPELNKQNISSKESDELVVIPEIHEVKVDEKNVSRSYDDNCDFERAEECGEYED